MQPSFGAKPVFGLLLREAYYDAIAITGAVLLHWFATKQQPSAATAQTAILVLKRETLPGSGNTLLDPESASKSTFRLVFDLLVREALNSQFDEAQYSAYLEGLIRVLNEMATPRMIPGRIYGGFALDGFQTLTPELLAILAGNLPPTGDAGVSDLIQRLLNNYPEFQTDRTLRDFGYQFGRYAAALNDAPDQRFAVTVECFVANPDLATLRIRVKAIFDGVVTLIEKHRVRRIQEAPLDETRLEAVRDAVKRALLAETHPGGPFSPTTVGRTNRTVEARETTFRAIDRGSFTRPEMSSITSSDLQPHFAEVARNYFQNIIWHELRRRPKIIEDFDTQLGVAALLNRVQELAGAVELGDELILLLPNEPLGSSIYMTASGFPTEGLESYGITHQTGAAGGIGYTYAGTIGKIHIYIWQFQDGGVLCSRTLLKAVRFGRVHDLDAIFDFQLSDSGDPTKSEVRIWLALEFEWEDRQFIELRFSNTVDDSPENGNSP
jgi:hypothetical protein